MLTLPGAALAQAPAATVPADADSFVATLKNATAPASDRDAAAEQLIALAKRPEIARQVGALLLAGETPPEVRLRLIGAVARSWEAPGRLYRPLIELLDRGDAPLTAAVLPAIAAFRTREAIQTLTRFIGDGTPVDVRRSAIDALIQTTGRDDLGADPAAWRAWWDAHKSLDPPAWQDALAEGVWRRSQRLAADRALLADRVVEGFRRLYLALPAPPAEDRPKLIAQMLLRQRSELRDLAFELLNREIAAGNPIDGAVSDAASKLLASPDPTVRARAAGVLVQLPGQTSPPGLTEALGRETDPAAAERMLLAVARWPSPAARPDVLRWLETGDQPVHGSVEAALAMLNAGILDDPADRARVLAAIRRLHADQTPPAACKLLVMLGTESDLAAVRRLLKSPEQPVRSAAADALVSTPDAVDDLLAAARADPGLYSAAVRATATSRATAEGYRSLEALSGPSADAREAGLQQVAAALSATDLLAIATGPNLDAADRDALLSRLIQHGAGLRPGPEDPVAIAAGIVLLAETRLSMKRPETALAALEALPLGPAGIDPARVRRLRTIALLWTNHIEDAGALDAPADDWLDGCQASLGEPHARSILNQIRSRFGPTMTPEQSERLARLSESMPRRSTGKGAATPGPETPATSKEPPH